MRTPYEDYSSVSGNAVDRNYNQYNNSQNSAIPYHARENSLPFSYGPIGKTSTPLRRTVTRNSQTTNSINEYNRNDNDFGNVKKRLDYNFDFVINDRNITNVGNKTDGISKVNNNNNDQNYDFEINYNNSFHNNETDVKSIKTESHLTSPLLVRKTLANRSPTRNSSINTNANTNTISNVYTFDKNNGSGKLAGTNEMNGNGFSASYNGTKSHNGIGRNYIGYGGINDTNNYKGYSNGNNSIYGNTFKRTPIRDDFESSLRERREKVFNEYHSTINEKMVTTNKPAPPEPPQRHFLPSRNYSNEHFNSNNSNGSSAAKSNYNYDIEFNLNLDEVDSVKMPPRRAHTMERSSLQQYRTKDIPMLYNTLSSSKPISTSSYVERNYHTISSSGTNSLRENSTYGKTENERPQIDLVRKAENDSTNEYNIYRQKHAAISPLPPQHPQQSQLQRHQQQHQHQHQLQQQPQQQPPQQQQFIKKEEHHSSTATYGNENVSTYNDTNNNNANNNNIYNNNNIDLAKRVTLGVSQNRNDLSISPIYATSTKQMTTTIYNNNANNINNINYNRSNSSNDVTDNVTNVIHRNNRITEQDLTNIDYHYKANVNSLASPASPYGTRPETPAFPVTPRTLHGQPISILKQSSPPPYRADSGIGYSPEILNYNNETIYQTNYRPRLNSSLSMVNSEPQEVAAHLVKFAKDSSKFWYKPNISRDEAISLLLNAPPGTFLVRDSTTFKNAYGLVLRVAQPPPEATSNKPDELVRHYLIEPTTRGVRLKGLANEPVFTSLSALVYEHSINQMALPYLLRIPEADVAPPLMEPTLDQKQLLTHGAACNVLWLYSCDTESLTGEEAIRKAVRQLYAQKSLAPPTEVHFKVSLQGITLTDNTRKKFFRKHYAADMISFCAIDPDNRLWTYEEKATNDNDDNVAALKEKNATIVGVTKKVIFAFVARRSPSSKDNQCHVFCDLVITQPASAIVSFTNKILPTEKQKNYVL